MDIKNQENEKICELKKKVKNLNRSKLRLKKTLNTKIKNLEKQIEELKWDDTWDILEITNENN